MQKVRKLKGGKATHTHPEVFVRGGGTTSLGPEVVITAEEGTGRSLKGYFRLLFSDLKADFASFY